MHLRIMGQPFCFGYMNIMREVVGCRVNFDDMYLWQESKAFAKTSGGSSQQLLHERS